MFKNFLLSLVFLLLSNLGFSSSKPNILVIIVDDLGYGDLSSYGATDLKSPHIDSLISEGMRFSECFANCPVCSPTRAALLSGRTPFRDCIYGANEQQPFPADTPTVAHAG